MKCDELEKFRIVLSTEGYLSGNVEWFKNVYDAKEVDAAIAELKAENERLKATPEQIMKEVFDKVLIYPKEMVRLDDAYKLSVALRATRRALWIARAEWARSSALSYHLIESHPDKDVAATYKRKANRWERAKDKCLKKAEEYK